MTRYDKDQRVSVTLTVNGREYRRWIEPRLLLSDFIRDELGLTGTHVGCEHGVCGACTILLNGAPVRSCLKLAIDVGDGQITTIEGLVKDDEFGALRQAFSENHALQCGFCTPGIVVSVWDALKHASDSDLVDWEDVLSGHLCRCTGYVGIRQAIKALQAKEGGEAKA